MATITSASVCAPRATTLSCRKSEFANSNIAAKRRGSTKCQLAGSRRTAQPVTTAGLSEWLDNFPALAGARGLGTGEKSLKTEEGTKKLFVEERKGADAFAKFKSADDNDDELPNMKAVQTKFPMPDITKNRFVTGRAGNTGKEDAFFGLLKGATGGFAGGEKGLKEFVEEAKEVDEYQKRSQKANSK